MAEVHALRSTACGASLIFGGNLHRLNNKRSQADQEQQSMRIDIEDRIAQPQYSSGFWRADKNAVIIATGECNLELRDSAIAKVSGRCKINARHESKVKAKGHAIIDAGDCAEVTASDDVIVYAGGQARVNALGRSIVYAHDDCQIEAYEGSTIFAGGNCRLKVISWGAVTVYLSDNAAIDDLVGQANIRRE